MLCDKARSFTLPGRGHNERDKCHNSCLLLKQQPAETRCFLRNRSPFMFRSDLVCPAMVRWLGQFSYAVSVSPWVFLLTALLTISMAILTIVWQAIKTARLRAQGVIRYQ